MGVKMAEYSANAREGDDWLEKCMSCRHVYRRLDDNDTLYCRCRKGCRYEEFKPKRGNNNPGRHED